MEDPLVLKKYANSRLYDTEKSVYVTLGQVADRIRAGRRVKIHDAKNGEDVTAFILTQILLEEARGKNALLPVPLLHMIIQYGDNLLGEFFQKYFHQTFKNYVAHKEAVDAQFQQWLEMGMTLSQTARKSFSGMAPFQSFFESFGGPSRPSETDRTDGEEEHRG